jgi:hypothetical protein
VKYPLTAISALFGAISVEQAIPWMNPMKQVCLTGLAPKKIPVI